MLGRLVRGRNGCGLVLFDLSRQPVDPFHSLRRPDLARRPIDLDQEEVFGFKAKGESTNSPSGLYLVYLVGCGIFPRVSFTSTK